MKKIELIVIWDDGKKEVYEYSNILEAKMCKHGYETAFGNQIQWIGLREKKQEADNGH